MLLLTQAATSSCNLPPLTAPKSPRFLAQQRQHRPLLALLLAHTRRSNCGATPATRLSPTRPPSMHICPHTTSARPATSWARRRSCRCTSRCVVRGEAGPSLQLPHLQLLTLTFTVPCVVITVDSWYVQWHWVQADRGGGAALQGVDGNRCGPFLSRHDDVVMAAVSVLMSEAV